MTGKEHEIEPENTDDFIVAVWFDEMPEASEETHEWLRRELENVAGETGANLHDLYDDAEPTAELFRQVGERVRALGFDTYDSDTRFLVLPNGTPLAE